MRERYSSFFSFPVLGFTREGEGKPCAAQWDVLDRYPTMSLGFVDASSYSNLAKDEQD